MFQKKRTQLVIYRLCMYLMIVGSLLLCIFLISSFKKGTYDLEPLMGLSWHMNYETAKGYLSEYQLVEVRTAGEKEIYDYSGVVYQEVPVSVSLCFQNDELVEIDYHDQTHTLGFLKWQVKIEDHYGVPNENSSESASWFDNPVGQDTAIYLYDMVEGVQISFTCTTNPPDKGFFRDR